MSDSYAADLANRIQARLQREADEWAFGPPSAENPYDLSSSPEGMNQPELTGSLAGGAQQVLGTAREALGLTREQRPTTTLEGLVGLSRMGRQAVLPRPQDRYVPETEPVLRAAGEVLDVPFAVASKFGKQYVAPPVIDLLRRAGVSDEALRTFQEIMGLVGEMAVPGGALTASPRATAAISDIGRGVYALERAAVRANQRLGQAGAVQPAAFRAAQGVEDAVTELHNRAGGSTFNPRTGQSMGGEKEFAVGILTDMPERTMRVPGKVITREHVAQFMTQNADVLDNPSTKVGTWFNEAKNETVFDVVVTTKDRGVASFLGKKYDQEGIFDLSVIDPKTGLATREGYIPTGGSGAPAPGSLPGTARHRVRDVARVEARAQGFRERVSNEYLLSPPKDPLESTRVVDEAGKARRVYHGTGATFEKFSTNVSDEAALYGPGVYFTESPKIAGGYAGKIPPSRYPTNEDLAEYFKPGRIVKSHYGHDKVLEFTPGEKRPGARGWRVKVQSVDPKTGEPTGHPRIHWTTPDELVYPAAAPQVKPAFLDIRSPFDIDAKIDSDTVRKVTGAARDLLDAVGAKTSLYDYIRQPHTNEQLYDAVVRLAGGEKRMANIVLQKAGFDGITHMGGARTGSDPHRVWIAFEEAQVHAGVVPPEVQRARAVSRLEMNKAAENQPWWYDTTKIQKKYGDDTEPFLGFLAATSADKELGVNVLLAERVLDWWTAAGRPTGEAARGLTAGQVAGSARVTRQEAQRVLNTLTGDRITKDQVKVYNFHRALLGDSDAVVLDLWMGRAFGLNPTRFRDPLLYETVSEMVRTEAAAIGITPRAYQERIWVGLKYLAEGKMPPALGDVVFASGAERRKLLGRVDRKPGPESRHTLYLLGSLVLGDAAAGTTEP
jgi:hypothetical protein